MSIMLSNYSVYKFLIIITFNCFQDDVFLMFIKMEEPKDFVTWLQVAKVGVLKKA